VVGGGINHWSNDMKVTKFPIEVGLHCSTHGRFTMSINATYVKNWTPEHLIKCIMATSPEPMQITVYQSQHLVGDIELLDAFSVGCMYPVTFVCSDFLSGCWFEDMNAMCDVVVAPYYLNDALKDINHVTRIPNFCEVYIVQFADPLKKLLELYEKVKVLSHASIISLFPEHIDYRKLNNFCVKNKMTIVVRNES
jgi:hypothetical protein